MTEKTIQLGLFNYFKGPEVVIPNWAAPSWWEADVARLMPSGRWSEVEIKLTRADFNADSKKMDEVRTRGKGGEGWHSRVKHFELAEGDTRGPNQFYFAMPPELAATVEVPPWAGLYIARPWGKRVIITLEKKAPLLHLDKFTFMVPDRNVFYWRMWSEIQKVDTMRQKAAAK